MATTGPRLRFTMYYDVRDETLESSWFYGALDGTVPLITQAVKQDYLTRLGQVETVFQNVFSGDSILVGFRIDSIDRQDTPFFYRCSRREADRSGRPLPNVNQLNIVFQGRRDPPLPLPRRSTIRSGMRLSGFISSDQVGGRWTESFLENEVKGFTDVIGAPLIIAGDTFVLATGGKDNLFPVDNIIPSEIVGRNITRRANRRQTRKSQVS